MRWSWNNRPHWLRRLERRIAPYLIHLIAWLLVKTYRVVVAPIGGSPGFDPLLNGRVTMLPCFWHQQILYCVYYLIDAMSHGFKAGFLISPSKDGDIGARIFEFLDVPFIRGSSSSSGASSLRDIYLAVKQGLSIATPPDGPLGPARVFKEGWVNLSRLTGAPMLPMAYAADRYWTLNTWDRLMIPKPFARIVVAIGNPVYAGKELDSLGLTNLQHRMEDELNELTALARARL